MVITILTLFPQIFKEVFSFSIIKRAIDRQLVKIKIVDIRKFAPDKYKTVDDAPYGGGTGMLLKVDVLVHAIEKVRKNNNKIKEKVILLDPKGEQYNQQKTRSFAKYDHLILICGHYEGVDDRIKHFIDESITIGEYILSGGEIAAMVVTDSLVRLIPGVLKRKEAVREESFTFGKSKEAPQYTRPSSFRGYKVPEILLSGDHGKIDKWKKQHHLKNKS